MSTRVSLNASLRVSYGFPDLQKTRMSLTMVHVPESYHPLLLFPLFHLCFPSCSCYLFTLTSLILLSAFASPPPPFLLSIPPSLGPFTFLLQCLSSSTPPLHHLCCLSTSLFFLHLSSFSTHFWNEVACISTADLLLYFEGKMSHRGSKREP